METHNSSEIDIMHEFIKLRNCADSHLTAFLRFSALEEKIISREYYDAFCSVADIYCTIHRLSALSVEENNMLSNLTDIIKIKAEKV